MFMERKKAESRLKTEITNAIKNEHTVYKCIRCGYVGVDNLNAVTQFELPETYKNISGGLCHECYREIRKKRKEKPYFCSEF